MRIRVLHVVDTLETGGLEKGVVKLIQNMDAGAFEHVVCAVRRVAALANELPADRSRVLCLNRNEPGFSFLAGPIARVIRETGPDIVHSRNAGTMEAVLAARYVGRCAVAHSEHGLEGSASRLESLPRRGFRRLVYSLADAVVSVSYQLRDLHARATGFPTDRISVIHNGVDTSHFQPSAKLRAAARDRFRVAPGVLCLGAVGRLEPVKDLGTLLRALTALPDDAPRWRLLVAGDGREAPQLREQVESRPELRGRVEFLGEVDDIPMLLNALDLYVLPSISEGISNSLIEAMSAGLPVIASAVGGNPEVVVDGESGVLFPAGDVSALAGAVAGLFRDSRRRDVLGGQARRRVIDQFSLDAMVGRYEQLYSDLAARAKSRSRGAAAANPRRDTAATSR